MKEVHGLSSSGPGPVDVFKIAERCGVHVGEAELGSFSGLLLQIDGVNGVLLRAGDSRRRKRFTLAHEIGHFCIPTHRRHTLPCTTTEQGDRVGRSSTEREADEFAVELLMPRQQVSALASTGAIDVAKSEGLAETFDTSLLAASLRLVDVTSEMAGVVFYDEGVVRWIHRAGLPYGLPPIGTAPPAGSVALDVHHGHEGDRSATKVDPMVWLADGRNVNEDYELLESSIAMREGRSILTILWLIGGEPED